MADAIVGALRVLLSADTAQFDKALAGADSHVTKLANTMKRDLAPSQTAVNNLVRQFLGSKEIGAANAYAQAVEKIGGANKLTAADQAKVNRAVTDAIAHYKALGQQAPAHLQALAAATKQVQAPTDKLNTTMATMKGVLGAFGIQLGLSSLVSFGKSVFNTADQIGDLALTMGVSTDAAQRFQYAARQSGAEVEDVTRALVQMNDRLAEGGTGTIAALTAAGLKFQDIRAMKPEDAFRAVSDAIGGIADPMRQTQVAMELFGKAGVQILAMIREGSLDASDGITIMGEETVKRLKDAQQAWENFWNSLTIMTGNAIPKIMDEWNTMIRDLATGAKFLANLMQSGGNVGVAFAIGQAESDAKAYVQAFDKAFDKAFADQAKSRVSSAPKTLTAAEEAALKRLEEAAQKAEERYQAFKRSALGLSDALKEQLGWEIRLIHEELKRGKGLPAVIAAQFKVGEGLDGITKRMPNYVSFLNITGELEKKKSESLNVMAAAIAKINGLVNRTPTSSLLTGGISGASIDATGLAASLKGVDALNQKLRLTSEVLAAVGRSGTGAFGAIMSYVSRATDVVFQYIVASRAAKAANDAVALSAAAANVAMGVATLGISVAVTGFMSARASAAAYDKQLRELTQSIDEFGATAVDVGPKWKRNFVDTLAPVQDQLDKLTKLFSAVGDGFSRLTQSLVKFGGVAPSALHGLIKQLLASTKLTKEQRALLEGMAGAPSWQVLQERAEKLGISLSALGTKFSQARISEIALQYARDLTMFDEAGADMTGVITGMADELSVLAQEAIKSGAALPKSLEAYYLRLIEMGLLIDENGNKIEAGALTFKDIEDEALTQVVNVLEEILELLKLISGISLDGLTTPVSGFSRFRARTNPPGTPGTRVPGTGPGADETVPLPGYRPGTGWSGADWRIPELPSFTGGTHGQFMDFGAGTPVMLHGREQVLTEAEGAFRESPYGGGGTAIIQIDSRVLAEVLVPALPGATKRYRVGR